MGNEMDNMRDAMKDVKYQRIMRDLQGKLDGHLNLSDSLGVALNAVVEAANAEAGTFWFYNKFGDNLIYPRSVYRGDPLIGVTLTPGQGIAGQVIENGKPVIVSDCQSDPRWANKIDEKTGFVTVTMICVPLIVDKYVIGCVQIINKTDNSFFDKTDLNFAVALAESSGSLFKASGLLEGYEDGIDFDAATVAFRDIFCANDLKMMHHYLMQVEAVSELNNKELREVMRLSEEMFAVFQKRRKKEDEQRASQSDKSSLFFWR